MDTVVAAVPRAAMTRRPRLALVSDIATAGLILAILLGGLFVLNRTITGKIQADAVASAFQLLEHDAHMLVETWSTILDRVRLMQDKADAISAARRQGDAPAAARLTAELATGIGMSIPGLIQVSGIDVHGIMSWTTIGTLQTHPDLAERPHISAILRDGRESAMSPALTGLHTGRPSFFFARAQRDGTGALAGISTVAFDQDEAEKLMVAAVRDHQVVVALLRNDSIVLTRSDGDFNGLDISAQPGIVRMPPGQTYVRLRGPSPIDGILRIGVKMAVPGGDLSVVVSRDEAAALRDAREAERDIQTLLLILAAILTLCAVAAFVVARRRRRTQAELTRLAAAASHNAFLHEIADQSPHLVGLLDHQLRYVYVNRQVQSQTGLEPEIAIGRTMGILLTPETRETVHAAFRSLTQAGQSRTIHFTLTDPAGQLRHQECEATRVQLPERPGAEGLGWFFVTRDETARRLAEASLRRVILAREAVSARIAEQAQAIALLDTSRLDTGTVVAHAVPFDLDLLIRRLVHEFGRQADERQLQMRMCGVFPWVQSDPALLETVLRNLIGNAIRFTDHGGVLISGQIRGQRLTLGVWDTGIGMDGAQVERAFQKFERVHDDPSRPGFGLGLAIARRISAIIGCSLSVRSRQARGSHFSLSVPLAAMVAETEY